MKLFTEKHKTNSGIMTSLSMQPDGLQSSQSSVVSLPSVWWDVLRTTYGSRK